MNKMVRWKNGSYTIEASLLMVIIVPLLAGVIYLGIYLHDKAVLQNAAYEIAAVASLYQKEEQVMSVINEKKRELMERRLIKTEGTGGCVKLSEKEITVKLQGSFRVPSMILRFFHGGTLFIDTELEMPLTNAVDMIRKIRVINGIVAGGKE